MRYESRMIELRKQKIAELKTEDLNQTNGALKELRDSRYRWAIIAAKYETLLLHDN